MISQHIYSIPIGEPQKGESAVFRKPEFVQSQLPFTYNPKIITLQDAIIDSFQQYADEDCLGTRNLTNGKYQFQNYKTVFGIASELGSGILNLDLTAIERQSGVQIKPIGVFSKNREEWTVLDIANSLFGLTMVPFYDTLGPDSIGFVLKNSQISTCFTSNEGIKTLSKVVDFQKLNTVVSFDLELDPESVKILIEKQIRILHFKEVQENGKLNPQPFAQVNPETIFTFSYTSGTTGDPKAAMLSQGNFLSILIKNNASMLFHPGDNHLSYLPLPHVYERYIQALMLTAGGSISYYGGDVLKLGEDIINAKPTIFATVPRILNKYYDGMKMKISLSSPNKQKQYEVAIQEKTENILSHCQFTHEIWDNILFHDFRAMFGGKIRFIITAAAPIAQEVLNFLQVVLSCPIYEVYAQTESSAAAFVTSNLDPYSGHVGGPVDIIEFQVVDVPEMEYLSTDQNKDGQLTPRGEICLRGANVFQGYYQDPEKTKEAIDKDGWLHSGDIGIILPNGSLQIVDRKKNIFKLSQGEYVSPEKLENIYRRAKGVAEIFVHGNSNENFVVAIVVPNEQVLLILADQLGLKGSFKELCSDPKLEEAILEILEDHGRDNKLMGFEIIRRVFLEPLSLILHGCVTNTLQLQRNIASKKFESQINEMYLKK